MAPSTQQAVVVSDFAGGSHDIRGFVSVGDVPVIPPAAGEVLVKLLLRPVNPAGTPARVCSIPLQASMCCRVHILDPVTIKSIVPVPAYRLLPHQWGFREDTSLSVHARHRRRVLLHDSDPTDTVQDGWQSQGCTSINYTSGTVTSALRVAIRGRSGRRERTRSSQIPARAAGGRAAMADTEQPTAGPRQGGGHLPAVSRRARGPFGTDLPRSHSGPGTIKTTPLSPKSAV